MNSWLRFICKMLFVTAAILWVALLLSCLSGCRVTQQKCQQLYPPPPADTASNHYFFVTQRVHDTTVIAPGDSSFIEALLQCDENNNVLVEELARRTGVISHYSWTMERLKNEEKQIRARFTCKCDSQAIYLQMRLLDTTHRELTVVKQPYPVLVEKDLTRWQRFKIDWGDWMVGLILFAISLSAYRLYRMLKPSVS